MGILKRVNGLVAAQLNDIVDGFERPEQMLRQAIREMEAALVVATESTAKAIAGEKRLGQQLVDCRTQSQLWQNRAAQCVKDGDDATARRALARKFEQDQLADALAEQLGRAEEAVGRLRRRHDAMRGRLSDARRHLTSLVARQRSAEAQTRFAKALGHFESDFGALDRFDALSRRVAEAEAEAEAIGELYRVDIEEFPLDKHIDTELRALKEKLSELELRAQRSPVPERPEQAG